MKKLFLTAFFLIGAIALQAQKAPVKTAQTKTSSVTEKVHNVVDPQHKEYNGYKVKKKTANGKKYVKKVNTEEHTTTIKTKKVGDLDKKVATVSNK